MSTAPLVSVVLAVHDGEPHVRLAVESVLRQSVRDLELIVVDDASADATPATLAGVHDPRLRVIRNDVQLGLAGSLNRGLDEARGTYVARMDADDAAFPTWIDACLRLLGSASGLALVGTGVVDVDAAACPGRVHLLDAGRLASRWRALFSAPVFHDTVVVERGVLETNGLRYDTAYGESEDYDLWTRLLEVADADNVEEALVLHRLHQRQASVRRAELQRSLARAISLRQIAQVAPELGEAEAGLARAAWLGSADGDLAAAATALVVVERAFEDLHRGRAAELDVVRAAVARALARIARDAPRGSGRTIVREAMRLDPLLPVHAAVRRARRRGLERGVARDVDRLVRTLDAAPDPPPVRVAAVFPEPTPYRAPLLDRIAANPQIDLTVLYAADTVAGRTWSVDPKHRSVFLRGVRIPGAQRILHHDYPVTPGVVGALMDARPEVVVVSGWSTFAAQAAITWCGVRDIPYLLVVESHDEGPRAGWRRKVKGTVVPPIVERAAGLLVTGTLARDSMIARGAHPERVRVFANTVDVERFGRRVDALAASRSELREALGARDDDVIVLSVARLAPEKGLDVLVRAVADAADARLLLVVAGEGLERRRLEALAREVGVRLVLVGDVDWERIVELYAAADCFALLSEREPWAVVVNEAAACGLPLVLSDRVGAAHDLLRDGENGRLVPAGDVEAAGVALRELAAEPERRIAWGMRSRELAGDWGYEPSVEGFLEAVREAVAQRG